MKMVRGLRRSRAVLLLALLAVAGVLLVSEWSYVRSSEALESVGRLAQSRLDLQSLQRALLQAESRERAYLLTERAEHRAQYLAAAQAASEAMARFRVHPPGAAGAAADVDRIGQLVEAQLGHMRRIVELHDAGQTADWRSLVDTDDRRFAADALQDAFRDRLAAESARIDSGRHLVLESLMSNRFGVAGIALLGLIALVLYLRQTAAFDAAHAAQQQRLVEERDRLETQVKERTALLTELTSHLQSTREDERSRLARELHDELGALLTAAKLDVARLKSRLPDMTVEAATRIAHLNETLNNGIALKRRIIEELRPSSLGNLGLVAALDIQAHEFAEKSGLAVRTTFEAAKLTPSVELTVYRLVQEALDNIAKFASAKTVDISMLWDDDHVVVSVRDDGRGFDPTVPRPDSHGLVSMRYRVEAEHGTMQVESQIGVGTTVTAKLPLLP